MLSTERNNPNLNPETITKFLSSPLNFASHLLWLTQKLINKTLIKINLRNLKQANNNFKFLIYSS